MRARHRTPCGRGHTEALGLAVLRGVAVALGLTACARATPVTPEPPPATTAPAAEAPDGVQVLDVQIELACAPDQEVAGLGAAHLQRALAADVTSIEGVAGVGAVPAGQQRAAVGVHLTVAWQAVDADGSPQPLQGSPGDATLLVSVEAQADAIPAVGDRARAMRRIDAPVPLPEDRRKDLAAFIQTRVQLAARAAVTDALGELWASARTDADLLHALAGPPVWRQMAAAREAGERRLERAVGSLEKLASSSRRDPAVVALAALGRLHVPASLPTLLLRIEAHDLAIADAALQALADFPSPDVTVRLTAFAEEEERPAPLRARARWLLDARKVRE